LRYICTYFDINFLPRGLALLDSLENYSNDFILYILALDNEVVDYLEKLNNKNISIITLEQYSLYFNIDKTKYKNKKEFYFSLTPAICLYLLKKYKDIDILLYLDADVYLFNNIEILYSEISNASIAICSHRLPWYINLVSKNYGIYNVGVNSFRNDDEGNKCLNQWHKDCSTWRQGQKDYPLNFFSDQIWLDKWPSLYKNLKVIEHIGINVAPWNAIQYKFNKKDNQYFVDNTPLVIYHFSSLKKINNNIWNGNTSFTILNIKNSLLDIYIQYINNIEEYNTINSTSINLRFSGGKLKMIIYNILKLFHNHSIKINKGMK